MARRKAFLAVAVGCLALLATAPLGLCGEGPPPGGGRRGMFDRSRFQQMMLERIKDTLEVEDDAWTVVGPRLEAVMTLSRQAGGQSGMRGLFGRRRRPGGEQPAEQPDVETPATEKAQRELETVLENKEATPEEIKAKLTALRDAREKAKDEFARAKENLREVLTQRQEAQLVLFGLLD